MDLIPTSLRAVASKILQLGLRLRQKEGDRHAKAEKLTNDIGRFPQSCNIAERRTVSDPGSISCLLRSQPLTHGAVTMF
mgnify:CR=1 FL=1